MEKIATQADDLSSAFNAIKNRERDIEIQPVSVKSLRAQPDAIYAENRPLRITPASLARLCKQAGAPTTYIQNLDPHLTASILQHHVDRGDFGDNVTTVFSRDGDLIGFGRDDLLHLGGAEVLESVVQGIGYETRRLHVGDLSFYETEESYQLDLISEDVAEEVFPGDVIQAGVRVMHSFIGGFATSVEGYFLRLVCSNGMTHRECVTKRAARTRRLPAHLDGARELQRVQIQRLAAEAWSSLRIKLDTLSTLREEPVDVERLFVRWLERSRLSVRSLLPALIDGWEQEGREANTFGALNAITRVATHHPELNLRQRRFLSGLAGILAFRRLHFCPHCFSVLGGRDANGKIETTTNPDS